MSLGSIARKRWSEEANEIIKKEDIRHFTDGFDHKKDDLFIIHYPVTICQAIVEWGEDGTNLENILTAADHGLYEAKESGRNTVFFRGEPRSVGIKPIKYTPELLEILHNDSMKKGVFELVGLFETASEKKPAEALEFARNTLGDKEVQKK